MTRGVLFGVLILLGVGLIVALIFFGAKLGDAAGELRETNRNVDEIQASPLGFLIGR